MNFKKELISTLIEMTFAFIVIVFSLNLWNNFDKTSYETANYFSKTKDVIVDMDDVPVVLSNDEKKVENNILYLHNISAKDNTATLMIKINKNNVLFINNTILKINDKYYDLKDLYFEEDSDYYYIFLEKVNFSGYETKELNVKILTKEDVNENIGEYLDYEFVSKI